MIQNITKLTKRITLLGNAHRKLNELIKKEKLELKKENMIDLHNRLIDRKIELINEFYNNINKREVRS